MSILMKELEASSNLFGSNAPYVEELYEQYLTDPNSVEASWRTAFDAWQKDNAAKRDVPHSPVIAAFENLARNAPTSRQPPTATDDKSLKVRQYIRARRVMG